MRIPMMKRSSLLASRRSTVLVVIALCSSPAPTGAWGSMHTLDQDPIETTTPNRRWRRELRSYSALLDTQVFIASSTWAMTTQAWRVGDRIMRRTHS